MKHKNRYRTISKARRSSHSIVLFSFTYREVPVENDSNNGDSQLILSDAEWIRQCHITRIQMIVNAVWHDENNIHDDFDQYLENIPIDK